MWTIYTILTVMLWAINIALVMMLVWLFIWTVRRIFSVIKNKKLIDAIGKQVDREITAKMGLSINEAWKSAEIVLRERAKCEEWNGPPPKEITDILNRLDVSVRDLFGKYKKIQFSDNGTLIDAECLLENKPPISEYVVGKNDWMGDILTIRTDGPRIYEVSGTVVRESYPSLIHYIAFVEDDTYWD
ncbi:MAG: hypothetical protein KJ757_04195 [Planctomycetes bacterium]|nr:hypothetical protein [Planctomycetota bacterium]MBU1518367.1 hypothetical protein [Planctomycetota bacterium]MBU2458243.1 hypothetical protein [Planctomycetota bacterium]MBU2596745.1 hypothetical protein [Planctomycetota bacterium]